MEKDTMIRYMLQVTIHVILNCLQYFTDSPKSFLPVLELPSMLVGRLRGLATCTRLVHCRHLTQMGAEGKFTYKWARPGLTVDTAVVAPPATAEADPCLLLIQV